PCPDAELLVALDSGELDEETEHRVRTHALFCKDCLEILLALERARPKRVEAVLRVARGIVECLRISEWAEVQPLPATAVTKGTELVLRAPFRAVQTVTDLDTEEESKVTLHVEEGLKPKRVRVVAECNPAREK